MNNNISSGDETRQFKPLNTEQIKQANNTGGQNRTRPNGTVPNGARPNSTGPNGQPGPANRNGQTRQISSVQPGQANRHGPNRPGQTSQTVQINSVQTRRSADEFNKTRVMQTVRPGGQTAEKITPRPGNNGANTSVPRRPTDNGGTVRNGNAADSKTRIMKAVLPDRSNSRSIVRAQSRPAPVFTQTRPNGPGRKNQLSGKKRSNGYGTEAVTGTLNSVMKAIIYIVFVLVTSGFLSYFGITVCNDVFAFVKSDDETEVVIPEFATIDDIAEELADKNIIRYPSIFKLYAQLRRDSGEYVAGEYTITPSMNYDLLLSRFKAKPKPREEVRITIPEGYTIDQIIDLFVSKDMGTREGFIDVIQNGDFSQYDFNWFIAELEANMSPDRKYRLEGYLFPDTYFFYTNSDEKTIIYKFLSNFNNKFAEKYKNRCAELGYTVDQIVTLASMIQAEAKYASEFSLVSSVFHNRLNNPNGPTQGRLESDPTVQYILEEHQADLDPALLETDNPYNTYKRKGLPPGPICNPGLNAIQFALYPAKTDYLYFVAFPNGYHKFAADLNTHHMNIIEARGGG